MAKIFSGAPEIAVDSMWNTDKKLNHQDTKRLQQKEFVIIEYSIISLFVLLVSWGFN